jgi:hypothetical protein
MGGKSQPAPDYSGMEQVAREQLNFAKQQYADLRPIAQEIAGLQAGAQRQQMEQASDYYDYMQSTFRPVEQSLVAQAQEFNTDAYRQQMAQQASTAAARAFEQSQAMTGRSLAARGVNPASGAARGADRATSLQQAAMRTQAMTGSRQQAEQMGYARMLDAAGLGRGLAGASTAAYAGATGAGTAGMGTYMAPGNQYQAGLANAGQTFGNMANMQNQAFMQAQANEAGMYGALIGGAATMGASALYKPGSSDRRLKDNIEYVGTDDVTGLNLYEFNYISDPDTRYIGVMADEVMDYNPDAVIEQDDGYFAVYYGMLGLEMVEVE